MSGVDGLGDGDEVGGVGDVDEAVVEVFVGAFGGVELAVVDPDVGALLGKGVGGVRRCPGGGGVGAGSRRWLRHRRWRQRRTRT